MTDVGPAGGDDPAERVLQLAQAEVVTTVLALGERGWIVEVEEYGAAQAQLVWAGFLSIGEGLELVRVQIVVAVPETAADAVAVRLPDDSMGFVVFLEGGSEVLADLQESVAQDIEVVTFHPSTQLWPQPDDLLGIAPLPMVPYDLVVQFTNAGPAYSLGVEDYVGLGYVTAESGEEGRATAAEATGYLRARQDAQPDGEGVLLPVEAAEAVPAAEPVAEQIVAQQPVEVEGRAGTRGRSSKAKAKAASPGRGPSSAKAKAQPPGQGAADVLQALRGVLHDELQPLRDRIDRLEGGPAAAPSPGLQALPSSATTAPLAPLFGAVGRAPGLAPAQAGAEARRLLGIGAPPPTLTGAPAVRSPRAHFAAEALPAPPPKRASALRAPPVRSSSTPTPGLPASSGERSGSAPPAQLDALGDSLSRIAAALERPQSGALLEESFGLGQAAATSPEDYAQLATAALGPGARGSGAVLLDRMKRTRIERPEVVVAAAEKALTEELRVLPGEGWSWQRHASMEVIPACGNFTTLKRAVQLVAGALDEGRTRGLEQQNAFLHHAYKVLETAARDPNHDMAYGWPILGLPDPAGPRRAQWAPAETAALAAYHREAAALLQIQKSATSGAASSSAGAAASAPDGASGAAAQDLAKQIKAAVKDALKGKGKGKQKGKDGAPN